ncbi:PAS domain-containing protein [Minwuia sp.]|uniref:PAS domain-containing protein n=1 Tax=Minwuia sp. TaxID=2493630 RepID=UPI003A8D5DA3
MNGSIMPSVTHAPATSLSDACALLIDRNVAGETVEMLSRLVEFWTGVRSHKCLLGRGDFGPQDLIFALPHLFMIDICPSAPMRYRLVGTRLASHFREDPTAREVGATNDAWGRAVVRPLVCRVVAETAPVLVMASGQPHLYSEPLFAAAALPLFDKTGAVNMILGAARFRSIIPGQPELPMEVEMLAISG